VRGEVLCGGDESKGMDPRSVVGRLQQPHARTHTRPQPFEVMTASAVAIVPACANSPTYAHC
jgi:hypothetical protein